MRLILFALAVANLRWALASIERSNRLAAEADAALDDGWRRYAYAQGLATRAYGLRI